METILKVMFNLSRNTYNSNSINAFSLSHVCDNDKMVVTGDSNFLVFSFAGSDDIQDWINNFRMDSLKEHRGFESSFEKFHDIVDKYMKTYFNRDIYVTGHSRGGALATQCAEYIAKNYGPCSCVTFGSPRIGNRTYRDMYNKLPINHTTVRNGWDIITYLPPVIYKHVGKVITLKQHWWHRFMYWRVKDHLKGSYTKAINKYYKNK